MNAITQTFTFNQSEDVRIVLDENNTPMFVAKDVAIALGYSDATNAVKQHCRGVVKHHPIKDSLNRTQNVRVIYEPDVYALIFGSKLPSAVKFQDWVFNDVLPTIRKTGTYTIPQTKPTNTLTNQEWTHLKQLVWLCEKNFHMKDSAGRAIWARLRDVTGVKSPERFTKDHLPILAVELKRIFRISEQYSQAVQSTERLIIRNVLKYSDDEPMEFFLAEMTQKATDYHQAKVERLPAFFGQELAQLTT